MTLEDANFSLKIEAVQRELGFVVIKNRVIAHGRNYFIRPIGFTAFPELHHELKGFQVAPPEVMMRNFDSCIITAESYLKQSAKAAMDMALSF